MLASTDSMLELWYGPPLPYAPMGTRMKAVDGPLPVAEHEAPAQFREELIQTGPEVVGELDFDDGFAPCGAHAQGRADDEGLLDGGIEDAVVAKFTAQRRLL